MAANTLRRIQWRNLNKRREKDRLVQISSAAAKKAAAGATSKRLTSKFDVSKLSPAIKKSPLKLKDWLDLHIPGVGRSTMDSIDPPGGQRGTILTIRHDRFETNRLNNHVTIGGTDAPVLAASTDEIKVLVTKDADSGPVKVQIGTHSAVRTAWL